MSAWVNKLTSIMEMLKYNALIMGFILLCSGMLGQDTLTRKEFNKQQKNFLVDDRHWTIEVPLWLPGFSGTFAYGDVELEGEDGTEIVNPIEPPDRPGFGDLLSRIFTTDWYLKFVFLTRVTYEKNSFIAQFDGLAGGVGEGTEFSFNRQEVVSAYFQTINLRLFAGHKFIEAFSRSKRFRYEFFVYAGVRAHFHRINSNLAGLSDPLAVSPNWFEPIIGIHNELTWKRWLWHIQGDYGGFFVSGKTSVQLSTFLYYRSGRFISLRAGWNHLFLNHEGTLRSEDFKMKVTLSGPSAGIAFHF
ncbi:MAG: hypothetical protein P8100_08055 [bacterium]